MKRKEFIEFCISGHVRGGGGAATGAALRGALEPVAGAIPRGRGDNAPSLLGAQRASTHRRCPPTHTRPATRKRHSRLSPKTKGAFIQLLRAQ